MAGIRDLIAARVPTSLFIGGAWREATGGTFDVITPSTEEVIFACPAASVADVEAAVAAATAALAAPWAATSGRDRAVVLRNIAAGIRADRDAFIRVEVADCGKVRAAATMSARS